MLSAKAHFSFRKDKNGCLTPQRKASVLFLICAEDNKPSFVFTRIIYLEHGSLRVSSFLQDATGGAEKQMLFRLAAELLRIGFTLTEGVAVFPVSSCLAFSP